MSVETEELEAVSVVGSGSVWTVVAQSLDSPTRYGVAADARMAVAIAEALEYGEEPVLLAGVESWQILWREETDCE